MQDAWSAIQGALRQRIGPEHYDVWIRGVVDVSASTPDRLVLSLPNRYYLDWIRDNFLGSIEQALVEHTGGTVPVDLDVASAERPPPAVATADAAPRSAAPAPAAPKSPPTRAARNSPGVAPDKTFHNFVVGACNQFAHAAAQAVADAPGEPQYNPLFIYGDTGLGKTHLMQAIGNQIRQATPDARVLYVTAEQFTNELIDSLRYHKQAEFRDKYRRQPDVLLLDDVQFIGGKDRTQEELFHTFEYLKDRGKQIVFTADVLPREIDKFEPRLRTRCESGMLADTQAPDVETMLAILRQKADELDLRIDDELAQWIAGRVLGSIRELEGVLNRLDAVSKLQLGGRPPTVELARKHLAGILPDAPAPLTADEIVQAVARFFSLKVADLKGTRRLKQIVRPRHIAMWLVREHTELSFPEIGRVFGNRDHSSVQHACKKIKRLRDKEPDLRNTVDTIERMLAR
ncbi:MAG: chromosomal replication initiator protein DnaA [Alphaproteobacteria bacterium]|nr:chromosomal replication initiator protein DnaA [Alphaproteobacteria bacterium]